MKRIGNKLDGGKRKARKQFHKIQRREGKGAAGKKLRGFNSDGKKGYTTADLVEELVAIQEGRWQRFL